MFSRRLLPLFVFTLALALTAHAVTGSSSRGGRNAQGYLGVVPGDLSAQQISALHVRGAEVMLVDHDGPGAKAGLHVHDIIVEMGGKVVDTADHLRQMLQNTAPGRVVSFIVLRNGQKQTVTATLADREEVGRQAWDNHMTVPEPEPNGFFNRPTGGFVPTPSVSVTAAPASTTLLGPSFTGALLETMSPQLADFFGVQNSGTGLLVRNVEADSPAASAGMRAGDVIVRIGGTILAGPNDWTRAILASRGKAITVFVLRDRREETLTMTPDSKHRSALEAPDEVVIGMLVRP